MSGSVEYLLWQTDENIPQIHWESWAKPVLATDSKIMGFICFLKDTGFLPHLEWNR